MFMTYPACFGFDSVFDSVFSGSELRYRFVADGAIILFTTFDCSKLKDDVMLVMHITSDNIETIVLVCDLSLGLG